MTNKIYDFRNIYFIEEKLNKNDVLQKISEICYSELHLVNNIDSVFLKLLKREEEDTTGFGNSIAIPHAIVGEISEPRIIILKLPSGVDWKAVDNKLVELVFCLLTPSADQHVDTMANFAKLLVNEETIKMMLKAKTVKELQDIIFAKFDMIDSNEEKNITNKYNENYPWYLAVSACSYGIAHTYLVEEKLMQYASVHKINMKVETHGNRGDLNIITDEDLKKAEGVILAVDRVIDLSHIKHNNIIKVRTTDVMKNVDNVFAKLNLNNNKHFISEFFKITIFKNLNYTSNITVNLMLFLGIAINIFIYTSQWVQIKNYPNFIYYSQSAAILAPMIFLGGLIYITLNKSFFVLGSLIIPAMAVSEYYFFNQEILSVGVLGCLGYFIIIYFTYKLSYYINYQLFNSHTIFKKISEDVLANIYHGIKWLINIVVPVAFTYLLLYTYSPLATLEADVYRYISKMNGYYLFRFTTTFIFLIGMMWDCGGPINKWTLLVSGILFYDSMSQDISNIWMQPITATSIGIVLPVSCVWFRGILWSKKLDIGEKEAIKEANRCVLRSISEGFIYFKNKYKWRADLANTITALIISILITFLGLKFYGGLINIFGIIFSFSTTSFINYPNIGFAIVTLTSIFLGGFIHAIIYPPKKVVEKRSNE